MQIIFLANVLVAGTVGFLSLCLPELAARTIFQSTAVSSPAMTITGAFWSSIAVLSAMGFFFPAQFSAVLLVQLLYKGLWLALVALPAVLRGEARLLPGGITFFFLVWVVVIPLVYPWQLLFGAANG